MKNLLLVSLCVVAIVATAKATGSISQLSEPAVVYLVLGGPDASGLYHRDNCPLILKGGVTSSMQLEDAQKRYFRPHCACIAGREAEPPCTETATQAISATTTAIDVSKYIGMATKDLVRLHGAPTSIIQDLWSYQKLGITLRVGGNKVLDAWTGFRAQPAAVVAPTPQNNSAPASGPTAQCKDGTFSYSKSRSGTCSGHGGVARWISG
jgi:hypothetical protein